MTGRRKAVIAAIVATLVIVVITLLVARSRRLVRRQVFPSTEKAASPVATAEDSLAKIHETKWTDRIIKLTSEGRWEDLDHELTEVAASKRSRYDTASMQYLHARAKLEIGDLDDAATLLAPFLEKGHPLREVALFHRAEIADEDDQPADAARWRGELIATPDSPYRDQAIEDQLAARSEGSDHTALLSLAANLAVTDPEAAREATARAAAILLTSGDRTRGMNLALPILKKSIADDAADRVSRAMDTPEIIGSLDGATLFLLGESARTHRHFDRAVAILDKALPLLPLRRDEVLFSIGRSFFGDEKFAEARTRYLEGAKGAKTPQMKASFLFHASRSAQLLGDDVAAEREMTAAIAVPGKFPSTSAALSQRMRTRLMKNRVPEARSDLAQVRKLFPSEHVVVEATIAFAIARLARGGAAEAIRELNSIPLNLQDKYDRYEIAYWHGRTRESASVEEAMTSYLSVLRAPVPTHFAYFARKRLASPQLAPKVTSLLSARRVAVTAMLAKKDFAGARKLQTDVVLLSPPAAQAADLAALRTIYQSIDAYNKVLSLEPSAIPSIGGGEPSRLQTLLSLGLFDDAVPDVQRRYPMSPMQSALTRSALLGKGSASRESILAVETLMQGVPDDFVPQLLPERLQRLLYPRYFLNFITEDAEKYEADPVLVLSIMREESRFNARAKSVAAARGLLQFIITTARDVGASLGIRDLDPEDLYDPRTIIQLGAKYVGSLLEEFEQNPYRAAAAYNAGPRQVALWNRISPSRENDYFLSTINFEETKHYVRKVLNSYERYGEIYGTAPSSGGIRAEP